MLEAWGPIWGALGGDIGGLGADFGGLGVDLGSLGADPGNLRAKGHSRAEGVTPQKSKNHEKPMGFSRFLEGRGFGK